MDKTPWVLLEKQRVQRSTPVPRLRLLTELEPRHREFLDNLMDLLWGRKTPPLRLTSRPARFWDDVFVPTGSHWNAFLESLFLHFLLVTLFVWGQSRVWETVKLFPSQKAAHQTITYYPPKRTFPAAESRAPKAPSKLQAKRAPAHAAPMAVKRQEKPNLVTPPDIKQAAARLPELPDAHGVTPPVPFEATNAPRRNALVEPGAVAPPPPVEQASARRPGGLQESAVAPAPELDASSGRKVKIPNAGGSRVIPPPPAVQSAADGARAGRLSSLPGGTTSPIQPPPAVQRAGNGAGDSRLGAMTRADSQVVPPPPAVHGMGTAAGAGRANALSPGAVPVVPPPPAVQQGAGNSAGNGRSSWRARAVPPPPAVQETGGPAGGRGGTLGGAGTEAVAPPPAVENADRSSGGGRMGSLSGAESPVAPSPSPSVIAGNPGVSGPGKVLEPMDPLPVDASAPGADDKMGTEELPLGLLGVVFAAPGSSYFSNFEVFIAKRKVGKVQLQLIKLVYEFLPYQRRLSEYDLTSLAPRVIKLRVTPDPSCDESLGDIIQTPADQNIPASERKPLPAALLAFDPSEVLHCYRTSADDFRKAITRSH
jgi:hypothetical protein